MWSALPTWRGTTSSTRTPSNTCERGRLPKPWLEFPNRNVYLRSDIEETLKQQTLKGAEETVQSLMERIDALPPDMQEEVKKMLKELGS